MAEVLIVGGGLFGLSTALSLARGRYKANPEKILVIDRSSNPPEQDAASSDLNKIVRGDYADPTYAELALQSVGKWLNDEDFKPYFHQSGIVVASSTAGSYGEHYVQSSYETQDKIYKDDRQAHGPVYLESEEAFSSALKAPGVVTGTKPAVAYSNAASGWAWSRGSLDMMARKCREAGVSFAAGQVNSLLLEDGDVKGARTEDGKECRANLVMLAAGSWCPAIFPELTGKVTATGQVLATIALTPEEAKQYANTPVYIDMQTGFYSFPPNYDNIVKFAFHHRGFTNKLPSLSNPSCSVSIPRTGHFDGNLDEQIPKASLDALRRELGRVWPELAKKPIEMTRMCWYADSLDCDFLIDYHDKYPSLFVATGDSGHAFKFLPVIGDLCVQAIDRTLPHHLKEAWSYTRERKDYKPDRGDSKLVPLDLRTLARAEDLRRPFESNTA